MTVRDPAAAPPDAPPEYLRSCAEGPVFDASRIVRDRDPHPP